MSVWLYYITSCFALLLSDLPCLPSNTAGFGFIAYGFGLSFFFPILTLGFISAQLNPALLLTLWIVGDINAQDFFVLSIADILGAFIGAGGLAST